MAGADQVVLIEDDHALSMVRNQADSTPPSSEDINANLQQDCDQLTIWPTDNCVIPIYKDSRDSNSKDTRPRPNGKNIQPFNL